MTVKECFKKYSNLYQFEEGSSEYLIDKEDFKLAVSEFTQFHIKEALQAVSDKFRGGIDDDAHEVILNAYPESNIK